MIKVNFTKKLDYVNGQKELHIKFKLSEKNICAAITGDSGTGKTTTLKILAGLLNPDKGFISVDNVIWFDSEKKINLSPQKRKIGMIFQDYALFPNMTVQKHILYANNDKDKLEFLLDLVDLKGFEKMYPSKLSGGQKQRLAIARAIAQEPRLLLFDEPFSALDLTMRQKLQDEIIKIKSIFDTNIFIVSHDVNEVNKLADYIFLISNGNICLKDSKFLRTR